MDATRNHQQNQVVEHINPHGAGPALILCEHASNRFPAPWGDLGLSGADRHSHAAWDPGARAVALHLSRALDAPLVASTVSRLVYDCNRPPEAATAMPARSEKITVPGNAALTEAERRSRIDGVYTPFHDAVSAAIAARSGRPGAIVTIHSFTPVFNDTPRAVELGILHDADTRLADAMLDEAHRLPHRRIERNAPYGPEDGVTHTLEKHALPAGLPNVMIEIRNDLLATPADETALADEVLTLLTPALARLDLVTGGARHA